MTKRRWYKVDTRVWCRRLKSAGTVEEVHYRRDGVMVFVLFDSMRDIVGLREEELEPLQEDTTSVAPKLR